MNNFSYSKKINKRCFVCVCVCVCLFVFVGTRRKARASKTNQRTAEKNKMNVERRVACKAERAFVRGALLSGRLRVDGRSDAQSRPLALSFGGNGCCEARLGRSRVLCQIGAVVAPPRDDRAHHGAYVFDVALSPMASAAFPKDGFTPGAPTKKEDRLFLFFYFFSFFF